MSLTRSLRALARTIKRTPARLLHPWRRRAARRLVAALAPRSVVFLCHGNICRSPFAAGLMRSLRPDASGSATDSAGLIGPDRPSPTEAIEAAAAWDVRLADHRSKLLTTTLARSADLIVVMDDRQARSARELGARDGRVLILGDLDPEPIDTRTIPDPVERPVDVFQACYRRIERCVKELVRHAG